MREPSERFVSVEQLPNGIEVRIAVERAPRASFWLHGPVRTLNSAADNTDWWLTVETDRLAWPVVKESFSNLGAARRRSEVIAETVRSGIFSARRPVFYRSPGG